MTPRIIPRLSISVLEAAASVGISLREARRLVQRGEWPSMGDIKLGRFVRHHGEDMVAWMSSRTQRGTGYTAEARR